MTKSKRTKLSYFIEAIVAVLVFSLTFELIAEPVQGYWAQQRGTADAERDIAAREMQFRIGGKLMGDFEQKASLMEQRFNARLVRSHGCISSNAERCYDAAYNGAMEAAMTHQVATFSFQDAYREVCEEARKLSLETPMP